MVKKRKSKDANQGREMILTDVENNLLMALTPGLGSDVKDVVHYIIRSWMLDHMKLEWIEQHASSKTQKKEIPDLELALIQALSRLEHEQWCSWAQEIAKNEHLSTERMKRWNRLLNTPYEKLTGAEQYQDKRWAMQVMEILWRMGIST